MQIFAFARIFTLMSRRWHACDQFDGSTLQQWFMAALRLADPNYAVGTPQDETVTLHAKRLYKALNWRNRGRVEEAAQPCLAVNPALVEEFRLRARWAAAPPESAALRCESERCDRLVRFTEEGDQSGKPAPQAALGTALVEDLLRTWVMEPSNEIRRRVGIMV
ncbi:MAG: hypothetical protein QM784_04345 [Polyangiaceae bacterium]